MQHHTQPKTRTRTRTWRSAHGILKGSQNWDARGVLQYGNIEGSQNWNPRRTLRYVRQRRIEIKNKLIYIKIAPFGPLGYLAPARQLHILYAAINYFTTISKSSNSNSLLKHFKDNGFVFSCHTGWYVLFHA